MKKILVFQHVPHEPLGTLNPLIKAHGFRIRYVNFAREPGAQPGLGNASALIVLGGPMNVDQTELHPHLAYEVQVIEEALCQGIPILGICLGAQLLAKALKASVTQNPEKEIGWYKLEVTEAGRQDRLLRALAGRERVFQWHGDTFDLPAGAVHLASSELCANQAFRYGEFAYGFQFHLEVDEALIQRWLSVPINLRELDGLQGKIDPERIATETPVAIQRLNELSAQVFGEFLNLIGSGRKYKGLCSR